MGADNFVVVDSKSGDAKTVDYSQVDQVKKVKGLSTGSKVLIGFAAAVAIVLVAVFVSYCRNEQGCR